MSVTQSTLADLTARMEQSEAAQPATPPEATTLNEQIVDTPPAISDNPSGEVLSPEVELSSNNISYNLDYNDSPAPAADDKANQPAVPSFNLDEELKKIDRKELLKKAGVTDFAIEIDEYLRKGGKAQDYLNAKSVDYSQVSDEELIKEDLKIQYPNLTRQEIERLYSRKYGVTDEMLDEEKEDRQIQLKADGHIKRQSKISQQQQFKVPENNIIHTDEGYEQWKQNKEAQSKIADDYRNYYDNHADTKSLYESKRVAVSLGDGVQPLNFDIDKPELLTKMYTDDGTIFNKVTSTQSGEPDVRKRQMLGLVAFNPEKVFRDIYNYGVQAGKQSLVAEGQNAKRPDGKVLPGDFNQKPTYAVGKFADRTRN